MDTISYENIERQENNEHHDKKRDTNKNVIQELNKVDTSYNPFLFIIPRLCQLERLLEKILSNRNIKDKTRSTRR